MIVGVEPKLTGLVTVERVWFRCRSTMQECDDVGKRSETLIGLRAVDGHCRSLSGREFESEFGCEELARSVRRVRRVGGSHGDLESLGCLRSILQSNGVSETGLENL